MPAYFKSPHLFVLWWMLHAPLKVALVIKRILMGLNNSISFTVNLRLLFTPLFGDYTIVGRLIGFTVRVFEIFFGLALMVAVAFLWIALPMAWLAFPFILFIEFKIKAFWLYLALYLLWSIAKYNTPEKKVKNCTQDDAIKAIRPNALTIYNNIISDYKRGIETLFNKPKVMLLLQRLELNDGKFLETLKSNQPQKMTDILDNTYLFAKETNSTFIEEEELFIGLVRSVQDINNILAKFESQMELFTAGATWIIAERERANRRYIWQDEYDHLILGGTGKGMTGRVTRFLDSMSEDFTRKALYENYERYSVRKETIDKLADLLNSSDENILVVGDSGSGKTSVVKGMAYQIMTGTSHKSLWNKRIVSIELAGLLSGTTSVGDVAKKLKYAIGEAKSSGDIILFIDEIHTLVSGSESKNPEMAAVFNLLEPELASGTIQFIGATTLSNYRKYIEPNGAFARLFHLFEIDEASVDETFRILQYVVRDLEYKKGIFITYPAIKKTIELSKKLIHERVLPDKAIQIIDRAAAYVENKTKYIDLKTVASVISEITHIPSEIVTQDEAQQVLKVEENMKQMVVGQDHALKQIASALKRARAGVRNTNKPIASFLFVGTTGVGKTQTAKALAKNYFGDAKAMIRLDMSEYQQLDSISRLLGAPDASTKGVLTEAVRTKPFALILMDEIEKAHPNILLTFLQVLDDGRLTDSSGTTIDFTNTIIIATSNVGTKEIQEVFDRNGSFEDMNQSAMTKVKAHFAPEFLNRFTGIIMFNPLSKDDVRKIINILLDSVKKSTLEKNITIEFKPELIEETLNRGYSKEWGARPLERVIEDTIEVYIAERILSKEFNPGDRIELGLEVFS